MNPEVNSENQKGSLERVVHNYLEYSKTEKAKDTDNKASAEGLWKKTVAQAAEGQKIAFVYSANYQSEAIPLYKGHQAGNPCFRPPGSNQAELMAHLADKINQEKRADNTRILPMTTCQKPGGKGRLTKAMVNESFQCIQKHIDDGWTVYVLTESEGGKYAIGGSVVTNFPKHYITCRLRALEGAKKLEGEFALIGGEFTEEEWPDKNQPADYQRSKSNKLQKQLPKKQQPPAKAQSKKKKTAQPPKTSTQPGKTQPAKIFLGILALLILAASIPLFALDIFIAAGITAGIGGVFLIFCLITPNAQQTTKPAPLELPVKTDQPPVRSDAVQSAANTADKKASQSKTTGAAKVVDHANNTSPQPSTPPSNPSSN